MAGSVKRIIRALTAAGIVIVFLAGCTELALKGTIKGLASPTNVLNIRINSVADRTFKVTWIDPKDADIDHIELSFRTPFATNTPPAPINVAPGIQTATVKVPYNNAWYFIIAKTVDKAGNKSPGVTQFDIVSNKLPYTTGLILSMDSYSNNGGLNPIPPGLIQSHTDYAYVNGLLSRSNYYTTPLPPGTLQSYQQYTYDANGRMTKQEYYYGTPATLSSFYSYTYDLNGNKTNEGYYNPTLYSNTTFEYDTSGNLIKETRYDNVGAQQYATVYSYDANGLVTKFIQYNATNTATGTWNIYWDNGTDFPSKFEIYSGTGALLGTFAFTLTSSSMTRSSYDPTGALTDYSVQSFDANGLQTREESFNQSGVSQYYSTYKYDLYGNQIEQIEYSAGVATYRTVSSY
jgi:hypothetical protein